MFSTQKPPGLLETVRNHCGNAAQYGKEIGLRFRYSEGQIEVFVDDKRQC